MKHLKVCLVLLGLTLLVASVQAADLAGSSSGVFENPTGPAGMVAGGEGTNHLTWGKPVPFIGQSSSLYFKGADYEANCDGTLFSIGTLRFDNGLIKSGTEATGVDLKISLDFTLPSVGVKTLTYDLGLINSFFLFPDAVVSLGTDPSSLSFSSKGTIYTVALHPFDDLCAWEWGSDCTDIYASATCKPVPEPGSLLILGNGLLGLAWTMRRRFARS